MANAGFGSGHCINGLHRLRLWGFLTFSLAETFFSQNCSPENYSNDYKHTERTVSQGDADSYFGNNDIKTFARVLFFAVLPYLVLLLSLELNVDVDDNYH